jgi:hypothetical protein
MPVGAAEIAIFPHCDSDETWETEIAVVNPNVGRTVFGTVRAFSDDGEEIDTLVVDLFPYARREITISNSFNNPGSIGYLTYESESASDTVLGYTKFYNSSRNQRVAVPAVVDINTGDMYVSHIHSDSDWWTGLSLLNTNQTAQTIIIDFDNGETTTVSLAAREHRAFTIRDLFDGQSQPDITSAVITNANGIVGVELFGSVTGGTQLSGILLKDDTAATIYYPHIISDDTWWTGIVAYNPANEATDITLTPYTAAGNVLTGQPLQIAAEGKYIGTVAALDLPEGTAWFKIEATNPITGFELFGTNDGKQLAGYTGVGIASSSGFFVKIEKFGWTGIAFVNIEADPAQIVLSAYDNAGVLVAREIFEMEGFQKVVDFPENIFSQLLTTATYIRYSASTQIVGFQVNGSDNNMMLDALPGMKN